MAWAGFSFFMKSRMSPAIMAVAAAFLAELGVFIYDYHPHILYFDQWDYYKPIFNSYSLLEGFLLQQGSHFLGLGFLTSYLAGILTGFSVAAESYLVLVLMLINSFLAIGLKRKLTESITWFDLFLIPMFLYTGYAEVFLWMAHGSVVAFPLMSILILGHLVLWKNPNRKYPALVLLFLLSLFTGYAFITSGIIFLYCLLQTIGSASRMPIGVALVLQLAGLALFAGLYATQGASVCAYTSLDAPFFSYSFNLLLGFFKAEPRLRDLTLLFAGILTPVIVAVFNKGQRMNSAPLFLLILFSGIYIFLNTFSRACLGPTAALAPRYSIFLLPAFLAVYIFITYKLQATGIKGQVVLLIFVATSLFLRYSSIVHIYSGVAEKSERIKNWVECYQENEELKECTGEKYKVPFGTSQISRAEDYMKHLGRLKAKEHK